MDLEAELAQARDLDVSELADAIESIGFECTRCGACCKGYDTDDGREPHTATFFPDEVRTVQETTGYDWRDVARPMPYGLTEGDDGPEGETFEWALQTAACGDCRFYEEDETGLGACQVHDDRPLICETYPFSVAVAGTSQPMGDAVDEEGVVRAHECEGLGRDISRADAEELARALKERAVREIHEAIAVSDVYEPVETGPGEVVVHDSEGAKRPDGTEAP
ncbi:YkgJ family cysteine cluster protein [Haloferax sp. MBLA0076]|uniref:YkgJ family cysteine cluster protein n=1 Tax=Haloferax litoreum TaxID=2666140 RepID=A0A6A8GER3_9EURY|nr:MULTISPECIES: YkgJ family cysteine cluster protein [Haloferax]KAB1192186.1 YkgJ family cysteine cluster protein [Haloferax sp. CBA1148]MRX20637.1 YkgJ family cysteine cluster protein [Haloferax litoreum]